MLFTNLYQIFTCLESRAILCDQNWRTLFYGMFIGMPLVTDVTSFLTVPNKKIRFTQWFPRKELSGWSITSFSEAAQCVNYDVDANAYESNFVVDSGLI